MHLNPSWHLQSIDSLYFHNNIYSKMISKKGEEELSCEKSRLAEPRGAASVCLLNIIQSYSCNILLGHVVFCSWRCLCQLSPTVVQYVFWSVSHKSSSALTALMINNSSMWDMHSAQTFYCMAYKISEQAKEFATRLPNKIFHSLTWAQPLLHILLCLVMKDILPAPKHLSKRADIWKVTTTQSSRTADARSDICWEINQAAAAAAPSPSPISITYTPTSCTGTHHNYFFFTLSTINHGNLSPQLKRSDISSTPFTHIIDLSNKFLWDRFKIAP